MNKGPKMGRLTYWLLLCMVVLPAVQLAHEGSSSLLAVAQDDEAEGAEDSAMEDEGVIENEADAATDDYEESTDSKKNVHSDADAILMFVKPSAYPTGESGGVVVELPAGQVVEFLVGFNNKGDDTDLTIEALDASFRYPLDFTYHIQNFSAVSYQKAVLSRQEASLLYSFIPADSFAGRSIGLTINLSYKDGAGNHYVDPVFNETVQIVEFTEGFDTEVIFMYIFLAAGALLVLFVLYGFVASKTRSKKPMAKPVETGTSNDDVDYEWIPRSALRTPVSGRASPRLRRSKRHAGSDTE